MKEKQIEIIIDLLTEFDEMGFVPTTAVPDPDAYAIEWKNKLTNALQGYRKQSEGEWEEFHGERFICNNCAKVFGLGSTATLYDVKRVWKYCPNCGAKMKGGAQE